MSLALGRVHYWLYNQIKTIEVREKEMITAFKEKYQATEVEEIIVNVRDKYGQLKGDKPLENLIGDSSIHSWLEETITTVQTREAAIIKKLMTKYDDKELLLKLYKENGAQLANEEADELESNDLQSAFELLKNIFLERMPCDRLSAVVHNKENKIVWRHDIKLHTEFWSETGVSIDLMHELYSNWIKGFLTAINSDIKHQRDLSEEQYEDILTL